VHIIQQRKGSREIDYYGVTDIKEKTYEDTDGYPKNMESGAGPQNNLESDECGSSSSSSSSSSSQKGALAAKRRYTRLEGSRHPFAVAKKAPASVGCETDVTPRVRKEKERR